LTTAVGKEKKKRRKSRFAKGTKKVSCIEREKKGERTNS